MNFITLFFQASVAPMAINGQGYGSYGNSATSAPQNGGGSNAATSAPQNGGFSSATSASQSGTSAPTSAQGSNGHCVVSACGRGLVQVRGYTNIPAADYDVLYKCIDSSNVSKISFCVNGCQDNGLGNADSCKYPTCSPNLQDCGRTLVEEKGFSIPDNQLDTLFTCGADGASTTNPANCALGCQNQGAGNPDVCRTAAIPANTCNAGVNACGRTAAEERGYTIANNQLDTLFSCGSDGRTLAKISDCYVGCRNGGLGKPDFCRAQTPSCPSGLLSCGRTLVQERGYSFPDSQLDTLFQCGTDGSTETQQQICQNGCINKGSGVPDACR